MGDREDDAPLGRRRALTAAGVAVVLVIAAAAVLLFAMKQPWMLLLLAPLFGALLWLDRAYLSRLETRPAHLDHTGEEWPFDDEEDEEPPA